MKYATLSSLTIGQYQELLSINTNKETDDIEKAVGCVSVLTGLPRWQVEELPITDFNKVSSELAIIFSTPAPDIKPKDKIRIGEKKYLIILNPRKLTAGQYIDIQTFIAAGAPQNMHKIIASMIVPLGRFGKRGKYDVKNHEQISEAVQGMRFVDINAICVFFLKMWQVSTVVIQDYFRKQVETMKIPEDQKTWLGEMNLQDIMAGYITRQGLPSLKG